MNSSQQLKISIPAYILKGHKKQQAIYQDKIVRNIIYKAFELHLLGYESLFDVSRDIKEWATIQSDSFSEDKVKRYIKHAYPLGIPIPSKSGYMHTRKELMKSHALFFRGRLVKEYTLLRYMMPYYVEDCADGGAIFRNRDYKPICFIPEAAVKDTAFAYKTNIEGMKPPFYFYNDGTTPWKGPKKLAEYFAKVTLFVCESVVSPSVALKHVEESKGCNA